MKKIIFILVSLISVNVLQAAALPYNMYFRAMQDEMKRTMKEYRIEKGPKIFYMAYKLVRIQQLSVQAVFGSRIPSSKHDSINIRTMVDLGTYKNDALGFRDSDDFYWSTGATSVPRSYEGIRQKLWLSSNEQILEQLKRYEKKQAYKKQKQIKQDDFYDFAPVKPSSYVEDLKKFNPPSQEYLEKLAKKLSDRGKEYSFLEDFSVYFSIYLKDSFFLNSEGSFYQYSEPKVDISFHGTIRHEKGFILRVSESLRFQELTEDKEPLLEQKANELLQKLVAQYKAPVVEKPYIGPVLLKPQAVALFLRQSFSFSNISPLLINDMDEDPSVSAFRNKLGMRVMSPGLSVYDRPSWREYKGYPLDFRPMDDEGVLSEDLQLINNGKLTALPLSRRSGKKGKSNGHGFMFGGYPREHPSTLVLEAKNPLSQKELEETLLERCREWEVDSCYIAHNFDSFERIDMKTGKRAFVLGLDLRHSYERSLRDILAVGDDFSVKSQMVVPSLLLEEVEIINKEQIPSRAPYIPRP